MSLQKYHSKRNFRKTTEPKGNSATSSGKLEFVVQRHQASHLHYDFRLEVNGVLKSWAVPKGPSMNPGDKRLAMMVEDHPFEYRTFKGVIPEGEYGAGIVEIWDHGTYSDENNSSKKDTEKYLLKGIKEGSFKFTLHGKKLKGEFAMVRLTRAGENAWLLIKHRDEYSTDKPYDSEKETPASSPINKFLSKKSTRNDRVAVKRSPAKKSTSKKKGPIEILLLRNRVRALPGKTRKFRHYIEPMLAKETDKAFSDQEWIYEMKWDGYRAIAECDGKKIKLYSRNGNSFNDSYPLIVEALQKLNLHAVIDGEIVVLDKNGKSDFQRLQYYRTDSEHPLQFRVFDILKANGKDITQVPLLKRKKLLKSILKKNAVVKYSDHIVERGLEFFKAAQMEDLEGIMAKKADSTYHIGKRTSDWLKIKNHKTADVIIAGFTKPTGSRQYFGALILAAYDGKKLKYIGHTGTGFSNKTLRELSAKLKPLITQTSPFSEEIRTNMPATWVNPKLVAEVKFTELTREGSLRIPVFLQLREDKKTTDITMSTLRPVKAPARSKKKKQRSGSGVMLTSSVEVLEAEDVSLKETILTIGKSKVKISNPNKIFWPKEKITKGDLIEYYISVSKYILPFLEGRPESLKRNPNGIIDSGFYHKDAGYDVPSFVKTKKIHSGSTGKDINYIVCNNAATLTYLNNLGCIELNPWHSTIDNLDKPDYVVIDIDPSEGNTFNQVVETAQVFNEILKRAKASCYCKTSGATGMHIYIPTEKKYTYDQLKDFAHVLCILAQEQLPEFTSLVRNLGKRGKKMIYLDYLQNRRGQTISSVYSLRPKPGAPVSMPLKWTEVKPGLEPLDFNIHNALKRIEKRKDAFTEVLGAGIDLMGTLKRLGA